MERTWVELKDIAPLFNMTFGSAKNAHYCGRFPIPVQRLGRSLVCDRAAVEEYFERFREESLEQVRRMR